MLSLTNTTDWRPSGNFGPSVMPSMLSNGDNPGVADKSTANDLRIGVSDAPFIDDMGNTSVAAPISAR